METSDIQKQIEELKQKSQLNRRERRNLARLEQKLHPSRGVSSFPWKSVSTKLLIIVIAGLIIAGIFGFVRSQPNLPPVDIEGHIEQNPRSHILDSEMPEPIQKHMLEHADGDSKNGLGLIIQYNCKKYSCEKGLIEKLKNVVKKYPKNVYLAPGNYDGKIILTKLGKQEILNDYDEKKIVEFITN